jgi:thiamine-monophosphate kinase
MGGAARHLFVSIAIPASTQIETLSAIYRGIKDVCRHYGVNLLGGDTSLSTEGLVINVTAVGEAGEKEVLYRDGANPDDEIYVTGTLGDSAAGLKLIMGEIQSGEPIASALMDAHNRPVPFLEAGRLVAGSGLASAMIDLSDGLFPDLGHICETSGTGAVLFYDTLPLSPELAALAEASRLNPRELALYGGEDYRLLITVPKANTDDFQGLFKNGSPCHVYRVGRITSEKGIRMITLDGTEEVIEARGFRHFSPV